MSVFFRSVASEYLTFTGGAQVRGSVKWTAAFGMYIQAAPGTSGMLLTCSNAGATPMVFEVWIDSLRKLNFSTDNVGTVTATTSAAFALATAFRVCAVFDGTGSTNDAKMKIYVDGVDQGPLSFSGTAPTSLTTTGNDVFVMGVRSGGTFYYDGYVDELRMWEAALTPQEVANDKICAVPPRLESLRVWHPLTGKTDSTSYAQAPASVLSFNTAGADGGALTIPSVGQMGSQAPRPSRRLRPKRAKTQSRVVAYPGFPLGI